MGELPQTTKTHLQDQPIEPISLTMKARRFVLEFVSLLLRSI